MSSILSFFFVVIFQFFPCYPHFSFFLFKFHTWIQVPSFSFPSSDAMEDQISGDLKCFIYFYIYLFIYLFIYYTCNIDSNSLPLTHTQAHWLPVTLTHLMISCLDAHSSSYSSFGYLFHSVFFSLIFMLFRSSFNFHIILFH